MKELEKPRFKVIADYPRSIFKIDEIIDNGYEFIFGDADGLKYSDFPHLFKKLNWWENRTEKEMPEYLKYRLNLDNENWIYHKIVKWNMEILNGILDIRKREGCDLRIWSSEHGYFPATKEEYDSYIANL